MKTLHFPLSASSPVCSGTQQRVLPWPPRNRKATHSPEWESNACLSNLQLNAVLLLHGLINHLKNNPKAIQKMTSQITSYHINKYKIWSSFHKYTNTECITYLFPLTSAYKRRMGEEKKRGERYISFNDLTYFTINLKCLYLSV